METLKPYARKMIYDIFNKLGIFPVSNRTFINNINVIYNHVLNGDYVQTSKRDRLIIISNVLKALKQTKAYNIVYEKAKFYNNEFLKNEYNQQLTETEKANYITYDELLKKLNILISIYNDDTTDANIKNVLILALYILHPPLRNDYYNMKIIYRDKDETDKKQNYILSINDSYYIIINNDKVINSHGRGEFPIMNKLLKNILNVYLKAHHPQNVYLFQRKDGTPNTKKQIQYIINKMFKSIDKTLTIYNLRSAYITDFYKKNLDIISRSNLADNMRHSKNIAELTYFKFL
jgi:hypothetical protein